ncbi:MAG: hypothetical protein PHO14_05390 [Kiritimatiellae bacterium]|jgi:hypothetical protein|nr:hypothetical protein [Kiritimatiellia bacterium]MDD4341651.1 hypothetical protein [Kiritimatiellia bacterium]MDY0149936.1 hypothetical protein [Kiritimatiellia bacterium]
MEQGSKTLLIILVAALLMGGLVIAFNPAYRQAFVCLLRGDPASSPIWTSNRDYYPDVALPAATPTAADSSSREPDHDAE